MATRGILPGLGLQTQNLPSMPEDQILSTASPARGREMRQNLLQKLRAPPLVHAWEFWHERQDRSSKRQPGATGAAALENSGGYEDRLVSLAQVTDVREFWEVFNNFDTTALPMRDAVHLFKKGVKPIWEDPRNARGGALSFRVSKEKAPEFWKEVCMMAIGEKLQDALKSNRLTFVDDICGVSYVVKWTGVVVSIWTRDGDHEEGIDQLRDLILNDLSEDLKPKRGFSKNDLWYKKHSEHKEFKGPTESASKDSGEHGNDDIKVVVQAE